MSMGASTPQPRRPEDRVLAPYEAYLRQRWQEGCHNSSRLWRGFDKRFSDLD
jgi:transposase